VTTAPVPVCLVVVVLWCVAAPQPAVSTATAAIQVVRTAAGYPADSSDKRGVISPM